MASNNLSARNLAMLIILSFSCGQAKSAERVAYFILAETVEPISIVRDGDPMAGGIMTEIVQLIFNHSDYIVEPVLLPWQRMKQVFTESSDWIVHGFPEAFGSDIPFELSELPIFPFNHSAVTLKDSGIRIQELEDLNKRTVILVDNFQYAQLDEYIDSVSGDGSEAKVGVVRAYTPKGTLEMLRHKRGDVVIDWQARLLYNLQAAGLSFDEVVFHDATKIVPTKNMHLVFSPKQSDDFRQFVNKRIKTLTTSGELSEIVEKYYRH